MRFARICSAAALAVTSCGGNSDDGLFDKMLGQGTAAGSSGAASGAAGSNSGGASSGTAGSGGAGGTSSQAGRPGSGGANTGGTRSDESCDELIDAAYERLSEARACDPDTSVPHCQTTVADPCGCTVPIEDAQSAEARAFQAAMAQIEINECTLICLSVVCPELQIGHCYENGSC